MPWCLVPWCLVHLALAHWSVTPQQQIGQFRAGSGLAQQWIGQFQAGSGLAGHDELHASEKMKVIHTFEHEIMEVWIKLCDNTIAYKVLLYMEAWHHYDIIMTHPPLLSCRSSTRPVVPCSEPPSPPSPPPTPPSLPTLPHLCHDVA